MLKEPPWPKLDQCQVTAQDLTTLHTVHHASHNYPPGNVAWSSPWAPNVIQPTRESGWTGPPELEPLPGFCSSSSLHTSLSQWTPIFQHTPSSANNTGVPCVRDRNVHNVFIPYNDTLLNYDNLSFPHCYQHCPFKSYHKETQNEENKMQITYY